MSNRYDIAAALTAQGVGFWRTSSGKLGVDRELWLSAHLVRCASFDGKPTVFVASEMPQPWNAVVDAVHWLAHDQSQRRGARGPVRVAFPAGTKPLVLDAATTLAAAGNQRGGPLAIELATYQLAGQTLTLRSVKSPVPDFGSSKKVLRWQSLLARRAGRLGAMPPIGRQLEQALGQAAPSFRWYRNASQKVFSGRVAGLEICRLSDGANAIILSNPRLTGGGRFGARQISGLVQTVTALANRRASSSNRIGMTDLEHMLESGVLRGSVPIAPRHARLGRPSLAPLAPNQPPLQFPALFSPHDRKRHIDALMRHGDVPWVVELKVARGGQGQYYRHAIAQAVLYRHFVRSALRLHSWFRGYGLDATRCEAAIAFPQLQGPTDMTHAIQATLADTAGTFLVGVDELDPWGQLRAACAP